jgi:hypothetical protein
LLTLLSDFNFLKAFHKKNRYEFNPNKEEVIEIVPPYFSIRSLSGVSYEMEFPKDADTKPPRRYYTSLEVIVCNSS